MSYIDNIKNKLQESWQNLTAFFEEKWESFTKTDFGQAVISAAERFSLGLTWLWNHTFQPLGEACAWLWKKAENTFSQKKNPVTPNLDVEDGNPTNQGSSKTDEQSRGLPIDTSGTNSQTKEDKLSMNTRVADESLNSVILPQLGNESLNSVILPQLGNESSVNSTLIFRDNQECSRSSLDMTDRTQLNTGASADSSDSQDNALTFSAEKPIVNGVKSVLSVFGFRNLGVLDAVSVALASETPRI